MTHSVVCDDRMTAMTNPYESPTTDSQGPNGILETTPEGWLRLRIYRTKEDWVALFQFSALRGPQAASYRGRRLLFPAIFLMIGMATSLLMQWLMPLLLAAPVAVFFWIRYPAMIKATMRHAAEELARTGRNLAAFGEQAITLTPREVRTDNAYTWSGVAWEAVETVELTDDYLFIFLTTTTAIPIRLRDFPDGESRKAFVDQTIAYFKAAREAAQIGA